MGSSQLGVSEGSSVRTSPSCFAVLYRETGRPTEEEGEIRGLYSLEAVRFRVIVQGAVSWVSWVPCSRQSVCLPST